MSWKFDMQGHLSITFAETVLDLSENQFATNIIIISIHKCYCADLPVGFELDREIEGRTRWHERVSTSGLLPDGAGDDYGDGRLCKVRFDANGAASMKRDPRDAKLLPVRHLLMPHDRVHYLQVACPPCSLL